MPRHSSSLLDPAYVCPHWHKLSQVRHLDPVTYVPRPVLVEQPEYNDPDEEMLTNWRPRLAPRICRRKGCGAKFVPKSKNQVYCSKRCQKEASKFMKVCEACGHTFRGKPEQRFCSLRCAHDARTDKSLERICPECGHTFKRRRRTQTYCSRTCWRKAWNRLIKCE